MKSQRDWVTILNPSPDARCRLFCLPYAGGGAAQYRTWPVRLPKDVEVCPIQLPGREMRFAEPRFTSIADLVRTLAPIMMSHLQKPFAIYGHSMGALIGFELIHALRRLGGPLPIRFFVAARQAPQLVETMAPLHKLPGPQFFEALRQRYGGIPDEAFNNQEIRDVFMPLLRADVEMVESYEYQSHEPLACPISVFGGREDLISEADLRAWQQQTKLPLFIRMIDGSHFFMNTAQAQLLTIIASQLSNDFAPLGPTS